MLNRKLATFYALVDDAVALVGANAPRVVDEIIEKAFPRTCAEAQIEGCDAMLREGAIKVIKPYLRSRAEKSVQPDFNDAAPGLMPLVEALHKPAYWVVSRGEYVAVEELIAAPALLDDARKHMRTKGEETLAEAGRLDALYRAITTS